MSQATVSEEGRSAVRRAAATTIHDADVHHGFGARDDLIPYIADVHRERFATYGLGAGLQPGSDRGDRGYRQDALAGGKVADGGAVVSTSPDLARAQLLDGCGIGWALLTGGQLMLAPAHSDRAYANALVSAFNEFSVERWLGADERFRLALAVNPRDPAAASAEIARHASNPRVVAVVLPAGAMMPYGQRVYEPIHSACVEHDLVLCIHPGSEGLGVNPAPTPTGYPSYYAETVLARLPPLQVHVASFVFEGVFSTRPELKVAVLEGGYTWVAPYLWYMDQSWEALRPQTPWVERHPSEYVLERVRFTTRPAEPAVPDDAIAATLRWMKADETLLFASDYPRWDWSDPALLPAPFRGTLHERIVGANASQFFRR